MGDFDDNFIQTLKEQSWALYSVGIFLICLRTYARMKRRGWQYLQLDDYLMFLVGGLYTSLVVCLNVIAQGGGSNLYPPEMEGTFTPEEIRERIYGSKIVVISEQSMLTVIYVIKTCMLIMYTRLTLGLATQTAVRYLAVYVLVGFISTEIAFFTACRPFHGYWAMPPPNAQCTTLEKYAIVQGCFNITSDLLMICIPLPLVLRMNVPWRQKIVLAFIFSLGFFVIIAALLTKIFNLTDVWEPTYMLWYVRESSVAVYVSNLPMIWPLLREWFPFLRHLTPKGPPTVSLERKYASNSGGGGGTGLGSRTAGGDILSSRSMRPGRGRRGSATSFDSTYELELELKGQPSSRIRNMGLGGGGDGRAEEGHHHHHSGNSISSNLHGATSSTEEIIPSGSNEHIAGSSSPPRSNRGENLSSSGLASTGSGTGGGSSGAVSAASLPQRHYDGSHSGRMGVNKSITVERTVVVEETLQGTGPSSHVFDWNQMGASHHNANVASSGFQ